jgi:hypothetical protein
VCYCVCMDGDSLQKTELVLLRWKTGNAAYAAPGSLTYMPSECDHLSWVAPADVEFLLDHPGTATICSRCAQA